MQEELDSLKDSLRSEKQKLAEVMSDRDRLKSLCDEKDAIIQVSVINFALLVISLILSPAFFLFFISVIYIYILQAVLLEKRSFEAKLAKLGNLPQENTAKKNLVGANNQVEFCNN